MSTHPHRTGRPLADAALAWAEQGGEAPPELDHISTSGQEILYRAAADALDAGLWQRTQPDHTPETGE